MDSTYATVGTVRSPSLLGGLVDLDVLDDQGTGVETLGIGVGLSVLEKTEEELGGLDGPAGLGNTELLACSRKIPSALVSLPHIHAYNLRLCFHREQGISLSRRTLGGSSGAAGVSSHGDGLLVLLHILEEGNSALQLPSVDGLGGLTSVLEGHSEVGTAGAGRLLGEDLLGSVSNLFPARSQSLMLQERKYSNVA